MQTVHIKAGDSWPPIRAHLYGPQRAMRGPEVPKGGLEDATISFRLYAGEELLLEADGAVADTRTGALEYRPTAGELDMAGCFEAEFVVTFANGDRLTCPNFTMIPVVIHSRAN